MKKETNNNALPMAIVAASLIIAGGLVFFGMQQSGGASNGNLDAAVEQGIQKFIERQEADAQNQRAKAEAEKAKLRAEAAKNLPKVGEHEYVAGAADAPITIIEYSDFECPFCKRFSGTMNEIMEEFDGKVNRVFRHFPLPFHTELAVKQAEAAECVGSLGGAEKFWEYNDLIFETTKSNVGMEASELPGLAAQIGIDKTNFTACLDNGDFAQKVQDDLASGQKSGVSGTPGSFIVNNKTGKTEFVNGALPFAAMKAQISAALK